MSEQFLRGADPDGLVYGFVLVGVSAARRLAKTLGVAHNIAAAQPVPSLTGAAPVLASLDIERTVTFYCTRLGFKRVYVEAGVWGIVSRDAVQIHFWACSDRSIPEKTSCRVYVAGIDELFSELESQGVIHPGAPLENKPWGSREFGVLDPDGNLVTFAERNHA